MARNRGWLLPDIVYYCCCCLMYVVYLHVSLVPVYIEVNIGVCLKCSPCYFLEHSFHEPGDYHFNNTGWPVDLLGSIDLCTAPSARAIAVCYYA